MKSILKMAIWGLAIVAMQQLPQGFFCECEAFLKMRGI
jgi:hypothetical protein